MEKLYNNSRGYFATFQADNGYLYLSSGVRKRISESGEFSAIDIFYDSDCNSIVIKPDDDGEFALNNKICLRSVKDRVKDGRHKVRFTTDENSQMVIVIGCQE